MLFPRHLVVTFCFLAVSLSAVEPHLHPTKTLWEASYEQGDSGQWPIATAWNGDRFLIVWTERYTNSPVSPTDRTINHVYGLLLDRNGTALSSEPICIATNFSNKWFPSAASNGKDFLVAWPDARNHSDPSAEFDIYGTPVSSSGIVKFQNGQLISYRAQIEADGPPQPGSTAPTPIGADVPSMTSYVDLAWNGSVYLAVWSDSAIFTYQVAGTRVTSEGEVLDSPPFPICSYPSFHELPTVASDGQDFFVAWMDSRNPSQSIWSDIFGAVVKSDGSVPNLLGIQISGPERGDAATFLPKIAFNNGVYGIAWSIQFAKTNSWIRRIDATGVFQDPAPVEIKKSTYGGLDIVPERDGFLVVMREQWDLGVEHLFTTPPQKKIVIASGAPSSPTAVATLDGRILISWRDANKIQMRLLDTAVSPFFTTIKDSESTFDLSWWAHPSAKYEIESTRDFENWTLIGEFSTPTTNGVYRVPKPPQASQFFRVKTGL